MENSKHQFKCKDEVIYRLNPLAPWNYGIYSHLQYKMDHVLVGGVIVDKHNQILPYKGYEDFVGTTKEPEPPVDLPIDSPVMALTDNNNWVYAIYKGEDDFAIGKMKVMFTNGTIIYPQIIVPHDKFDPLNLSSCIENEGLEMRETGFLHFIKKRGEVS